MCSYVCWVAYPQIFILKLSYFSYREIIQQIMKTLVLKSFLILVARDETNYYNEKLFSASQASKTESGYQRNSHRIS